jgi:hypothetical protein
MEEEKQAQEKRERFKSQLEQAMKMGMGPMGKPLMGLGQKLFGGQQQPQQPRTPTGTDTADQWWRQ